MTVTYAMLVPRERFKRNRVARARLDSKNLRVHTRQVLLANANFVLLHACHESSQVVST